MPQPLAHAFLALADEPFEAGRHTRPRTFAAAVAACALAVGTPLGYGVLKDHQPVGPMSSKIALAAPDHE
jgi:hypothetical protein